MGSPRRSLASPEDQGATFVELFFDLVFVFALTQVSHHAAHHFDARSLFETAVVFWLIWWAWTQFTWTLNAANTERHEVRLGTLIATGVAFVMAVSIEAAFGDGALWFAGSYVVVRLLGLGLYYRVAAHDAAQQQGVRTFARASMAGLALVLVGAFLSPDLRPWIWLGVVGLDVVAAYVAGRHADWHLNAEHFAERHGLIVIIALGESLIVAGAGVKTQEGGLGLLVDGILAVGATCLLWWTYFGWVKDAMEERLKGVPAHEEEAMARDAYSLLHFPLICGVVGFAVGLIGIVTRSGDTVSLATAGAMGVGAALFLVATTLAVRRTTGVWLWPRLLIAAAAVPAMYLAPARPAFLLGILCAGLVLTIVIEHVRCDPSRARGEADEEAA